MRETFSEWECMPGSAPGWIESMDAAGFEAGLEPPRGDAGSAMATVAAEAPVPAARCADAIPCLDLRHLPAPEPLERALAAADGLAPGAQLEVWTPMLPVPLLQLLEVRGYLASAELQKDGTARIVIRHGND